MLYLPKNKHVSKRKMITFEIFIVFFAKLRDGSVNFKSLLVKKEKKCLEHFELIVKLATRVDT